MTDTLLDELLDATAAFQDATTKAKAATQKVNETRSALLNCELKVRTTTPGATTELQCWIHRGYVIVCHGVNGPLSILSPLSVTTDNNRDF